MPTSAWSPPARNRVYVRCDTADPLHTDPSLQGRVLSLDSRLNLCRDRVLYRIDLAHLSAEQVAALRLHYRR